MKRQSAEIYGATATNEKRTTARKCGGKMDVMTRMMTDVRGQVSDIRPMTGTCPRATENSNLLIIMVVLVVIELLIKLEV